MKNIDDRIDRVLREESEDDARRLREVWEAAGSLASDRAAEPIDAALVDRVRMNLERYVEVSSAYAEPSGVTNSSRVRRARERVPRHSNQRPARDRARVRALTLAAAATVATIAIGLSWWNTPVVTTTNAGETLAVTLPDGSTVQVNSATTLSYSRGIGLFGDRIATVNGEAYFEVAESSRPFELGTYNARVEVVGTKFNVRAREEESLIGTVVALESGSVSVRANRGSATAMMRPGDVVRVGATQGRPRIDTVRTSISDAMAWMRGDFVFMDQPIEVILSDVMRRYNVDLRTSNGSDDGRRWNLALRQPSNAESVVRDVAAMVGMRYRRTSTGFELFSDHQE